VVLRDHHGGFVSVTCHFFPSVTDPESAELLASHPGVKLEWTSWHCSWTVQEL
jgi:hypothetical protein